MRKHWQHSPKTKPETKMSYLIVKALERWSIENKKWVQTLERDLCCLTEKKIVHVQQADKSTGKTIKTNRPQSGRSRSSLGHKSNSLLPDFVLQSCFLESKASGMTGLPPPPTSPFHLTEAPLSSLKKGSLLQGLEAPPTLWAQLNNSARGFLPPTQHREPICEIHSCLHLQPPS